MKKKILCVFLIFCCLFLVACNETTSSEMNIISVNDISINKSHAYVDVNKSVVLLAQVFPFNADNQKINWKSANPEIAVVSDGVVTGKSEGRTSILATSDDGELTASCIVYVSTPKLDYNNANKQTDFKINKTSEEVELDEPIDEEFNISFIEEFFNYQNTIHEMFEREFNLIDSFFESFDADNLTSEENSTEDKQIGFYYEYNSNGLNSIEKATDFKNVKEEILYEDDNTIVKKFYN